MEIAKGTNFFLGVTQAYHTENEPKVKVMKASRPFGASLLKKNWDESKKGKKGVAEERKENISHISLLTCFALMPTLILNKFARKRVLRRKT